MCGVPHWHVWNHQLITFPISLLCATLALINLYPNTVPHVSGIQRSKFYGCELTFDMYFFRLGTAVSVMAKIPLLECLTRHSYKECIEKSCSTPNKDSDETVEEKSTDSVLCPTPTKLPASFSAPGAGCSPDTAEGQESSEMTDSSGLRAALQEADSPERVNPLSFNVTLLDWINVQDRPNDVESVVRKCFDSINRVSHCCCLCLYVVVCVCMLSLLCLSVFVYV